MADTIISNTEEIISSIRKLNEEMYLVHDKLKFNIRAKKVGLKEVDEYKRIVIQIQEEMEKLLKELNRLFLVMPMDSIKKNDR
jgi:hypothetical protein